MVAPAKAGEKLVVLTEELPPYSYAAEGEVRGLCTDVLLAVAEQAGVGIARDDIQLMPWTRAIHRAVNDRRALLYGTVRTREREKLFQWVGPVAKLPTGIIAPKKRKVRLDSLHDLARYQVGTVRGTPADSRLRRAGIARRCVQTVPCFILNLRKLAAGRLDAITCSIPSAFAQMPQEGMDPDEYEVVWVFGELDLYFALNREADPKLAARLQTALDDLKRPGVDGKSEYEKIVGRHAPLLERRKPHGPEQGF